MLQIMRIVMRAAIGLVVLAAPASALTISPGSTTPLVAGNTYSYDSGPLGGGTGINDTFNFTIAGSLESDTAATAIHSNKNNGVKDLTIRWYDASSALMGTLFVTDSSGAAYPVVELVIALTAGTYKLTATGQTLSANGRYSLDVAVAATPLPPALLLFGTALVGMTLLGRRRGGKLEI